MSSWTFETYQNQHKTNPSWHVSASYRWDKGNTYSTFVGVFDEKGNQISTIFQNTYGSKNSARSAFRRQVKKLERGEY